LLSALTKYNLYDLKLETSSNVKDEPIDKQIIKDKYMTAQNQKKRHQEISLIKGSLNFAEE